MANNLVKEIEMNDYSEVNALNGRYKILLGVNRKSSKIIEITEKEPEGLDYLKDKVRKTYINWDGNYGKIRDEYFY